MNNTKGFVSLMIAIATLATVSCGSGSSTTENTTAASSGDTTVSADEYTYPDVNFGGGKFTMLNYDEMWGCNMDLNVEEESGERLDDAVYARNIKVGEKLGFEIEEIVLDYPGYEEIALIINQLTNSVMAGDKTYDAAYLPISFNPGVVTEGYLYDLAAMPNLQFDEEWWDHSINNSLVVNGKQYAASSPLHLMTLDMSWVLLFNQDILDDNKLDYPYQTVRDGKWTLDELNKYTKAVINLNGDDSFSWNESGKAVYGIARHADSIQGFIYAADNHLATLENGKFTYNMESERLYTTLEKVASIFQTDDGSGIASSSTPHYLEVFRNERALFATCELMSSLQLRDMEANYGLLPFPKFDESQQDYITAMNQASCFLTVPSNVDKPEVVGAILDALTYESYKELIPIYYDITLSYKGLRNEDSIEMLDIIRNSRGVELSQIFGITTDLQKSLQSITWNNDAASASSTIASGKNKVIENAEKLLETLK